MSRPAEVLAEALNWLEANSAEEALAAGEVAAHNKDAASRLKRDVRLPHAESRSARRRIAGAAWIALR